MICKRKIQPSKKEMTSPENLKFHIHIISISENMYFLYNIIVK